MWGLCLNPLLILLTVQQGNFDVIPTTLILWFLISLINFRRRSERVDWLIAAGWLGLGAFAKTFPLILVPLLIAEARRVDVKTRLLGALLCLGPAAISLAPLFSLGPHDVLSGVILYRGTPGPIGAAGLILLVAGAQPSSPTPPSSPPRCCRQWSPSPSASGADPCDAMPIWSSLRQSFYSP